MSQQDDILKAIKIAIVVINDDFTIAYMNDAAEDFCGGSAEKFKSMKLSQVIQAGEVQDTKLRHSFNSYDTYTIRETNLFIPAKQSDALANIAVSPIAGSKLLFEIEPLNRILFINKGEQMNRAQLASRQLVRGMAHEIKNPLGGIRGAAQLLQNELETTEQRQYTDIIISETDRLRSLVDRLLGPNESPCFNNVNIHEVLEKVLNLVSNDIDLDWSVTRDYDPSLPELHGDFDQLFQAMLNVVHNARDAVSEKDGPKLIVKTRVEHQFTIGSKRHTMVARIMVEDNGIGIPSKLQQQIFFPLVTSKPTGTGLGLAIAHTIIGMHEGLIVCDSKPGCTQFTIYLPLTQDIQTRKRSR